MQTKILSKFYTDAPLEVGADGEALPELVECDQPRVDFLDDGTPVMENKQWFELYKSCVDAVKSRDALIKIWVNWAERELEQQQLHNSQ